MPIQLNSKEAQEIRKLIPLATLSIDRFEQICARIDILTAAPGDYLFKRGENHNEFVYLLSGSVSLQASDMQVDVIDANSYSSRFPLAPHNPRKIDALALNAIHYIKFNTDCLIFEKETYDDEDSTYMTGYESDENPEDWMTALLSSPIFESLPPSNLQKILMSLEELQLPRGSVIMQQGSAGEFYYLIKQGQCILSRKPNPNARDIKLAQLRVGDTFGEDALLSEELMNVSVTALTDVSLLRLNKEKFNTLIKAPALKYIEFSELETELKAGAFIVDVRLQDDYINRHIKGSINAPFFSLLMQFKTFDRRRKIIVICNNGKSSSAAAFLLLRNKFHAKVLNNGLSGLPSDYSSSHVTFIHNAKVRHTFLEDNPNSATVDADSPSTAIADIESLVPAEKPTLDIVLSENKDLKDMLQKLQQQFLAHQEEKALIEKQYAELERKTEELSRKLQQQGAS